MIVQPGRVKPNNVKQGHTQGWSFTIVINGLELEPVRMNKPSFKSAEKLMYLIVDSLNKVGV